MLSSLINRLGCMRLAPKRILLHNSFTMSKTLYLSKLININHSQFKLSLQNKYYFGQNQPSLNPSNQKCSSDHSQKSSFQTNLNSNINSPPTLSNRFLSYLKLKLQSGFKKSIRSIHQTFNKICLLIFFLTMSYLGLLFLIMFLYMLAALNLILRQAIDRRRPQLTKAQTSQRYKTSISKFNILKIDKLIPTVKRAEQSVLQKIHYIRNSKIMTLLRLKGLNISRQTMLNVKRVKKRTNSHKLYPFYWSKKLFR